MEFDSVIKTRTSVRKFSDKQIKDEILEKILEAGNLAPTAKNIQPHKIFVVNTKDALLKLDKATPCRYNAPVCLIVCADESLAFSQNGHSTSDIDSTIVTTHMMLEATNLGVDNIFIKMFDEDTLYEEFDIERNLSIVCLLNLGYKADDCPESINHKKRKDIDEIVT